MQPSIVPRPMGAIGSWSLEGLGRKSGPQPYGGIVSVAPSYLLAIMLKSPEHF